MTKSSASQNKRLLARTVDDIAEKAPDQRFAVIPQGPELTNGFRGLSMKSLAQSVDFMCRWIETTIGLAQSRETLAYMGSNDVRYFIFMLACQKTGYQAFFPSTRNSDEAHKHLLTATNCKIFFFSKERETQVLNIRTLLSMDVFVVPAMETILGSEGDLRSYPYTKSYADAENETLCIIHSSGTTGMPKPIYLTNGFFMCIDAIAKLPWPTGRQPSLFFNLSSQDLVLATTPFFHGMGLISFVFAIWFGIPVLYGPDKPLSVEHFVGILRTAHLSYSSEALACLKELKSVYFGGAPLASQTGERLRQYTQIVPILGTSEIGLVPSLVPEDEVNWNYFEWNKAYGVDMQNLGDNLYEMVIPRQPNSRDFKSIFHTYPEVSIYPTNDLYTRHPKNVHLWKFHGRKDDIIVLSNGEKFNPIGMETVIVGHPLVGSAVIVGQSRFQAGLLVEPNQDIAEMDDKLFIEEIWPTVQMANQTIATHGRIVKSNIRVASKTKPFRRTPKGTVQRKAVLRDYEEEIDGMYAAEVEDDVAHYLPEPLGSETITEYIRQIVTCVLGKIDITSTEDLYSAGLDSLMTIQVSRTLQKGVQLRQPAVRPDAITPQIIYANPTMQQLSAVVLGILEGESQVGIPREDKIKGLVEKYTSDLPARRETRLEQRLHFPSTVVLTGSTGSLGTYLLYSILHSGSVSKVYCLNRSEARSRQENSFEARGLHVDANDLKDRVEFLQASFGEPRFGLDEDKYRELLDSVDTIIHNAWKVDFNHSVDSFEHTHIRGVRQFVDFSLRSRHSAHIHFVSSISTVGGWTADLGPSIPEQPMDSSVVLAQGYSESKHVAERICIEASRKSCVPTTVYRVGQVAGPTTSNGKWNPHEWLPTLVATSKALGKIPNRLGTMAIDWVPVDTLSSIIMEIIVTRYTNRYNTPWAVFHLVNPEQTRWSSLLPVIQDMYPVEPIELAEWVAELESIPRPSGTDIAEKPALKLLSFYRGLLDEGNTMSVALDVQLTKDASATMRSMGPVSASLMRNWLRQWQF
ncbi:hypothetical protein N7451_009754 [Penicillium sp. IBT 35674x]|nr:hypothetical protein N7451_009754 [Penicillium sp. IBT 35674x]